MDSETLPTVRCPFCGTPQKAAGGKKTKEYLCAACDKIYVYTSEFKEIAYPLIGKLAVTYHFINSEQLEHALQIQQSETQKGRHPSLEEVFAKLDLVTQKQMRVLKKVKNFMETRRLDKIWAEMAVGRQWVSKEDVDDALSFQGETFKIQRNIRCVGDILVERGKLKADQRDALFIQQGRMTAAEKFVDDSVTNRAPAIEVSEDGMTAVLIIPPSDKPMTTLEEVKRWLGEKGIVHGIASDENISAFVERAGRSQTEEMNIAIGDPVKEGRDAIVQYHFATEYLSAGRVAEDGSIDFHDRGQVPHVQTGDLLAQKTPPVSGRSGMDIFGREIEATEVKDVMLRCGVGAEFSGDEETVTAATDGQPMLSYAGVISINKSFKVDADVDFKTGNIDFDGNVTVAGSIRSGFHVKGCNLKAQEIDGGIVESGGDVDISGGIFDATVTAEGNVRASFIRNADIKAYGNVIVRKEIVDSKIEISGACQVSGGTILSSVVSAKKGVFSVHIGNGISKPSRLRVGMDDHIEGEIGLKERQVEETRNLLNEKKEQLRDLDDKHSVAQNMVSEMTHVQKRAKDEMEALQYTLDRFRKKRAKRTLGFAERRIQQYQDQIADTNGSMKSLLSELDDIKKRKEQLSFDFTRLETAILDLQKEREALKEWAQKDQPVGIVRVSGEIFDGTAVTGPHASTVLKSTYKNVQLREIKNSDPDQVSVYEIQVVKNT